MKICRTSNHQEKSYIHKVKYLLITIILSFNFASFYQIGDTVNAEHQSIPLSICHGEDADSTFYLGNNMGKITVLGIDATW